jgi:hypothetical protein
MELTFIHEIIWLVISGLIIFTAIVLLMPTLLFKNKKTKQDLLSSEKYIIQILCFCFFIFLPIIDLVGLDQNTCHSLTKYLLTTYLVSNSILSLFIQIEDFKAIQNPFYIFEHYLKNKYKNITFEVIYLVLLIISLTLIGLVYKDEDYLIVDISYLILNNIWLYVFCLVITISTFILEIVKQIIVKSYMSENKQKAVLRCRVELASIVLEVIYMASFIILLLLNTEKEVSDETFFILLNYIFLASTLLININSQFIISRTDYFFYTLGNTRLALFYKIYLPNVFSKPALSMEYSSFMGGKENSLMYFYDKLSYNIEEYIMDEIEASLNIALSSMFIIYSKFSKTSLKSVEKSLAKGESPTSSSSDPTKKRHSEKSDLESFTLEQVEVSKDVTTSEYVFRRNDMVNDFEHSFEKEKISRLLNTNVDKENCVVNPDRIPKIELRVRAFNMNDFSEIITVKGKADLFNLITIGLLSHYNNNTVTSLFTKNCKEELFRKQKRFIIKTHDKNFNIEILNEENVPTDFLKNYTKFMKSTRKSFLPLIVGVFKIKLNKFKEITMILSKNKVIEDVPKEYFNYWQLLRLQPDNKLEMVTSSKDRTSYLIQDDLIIFKTGAKLNLNNFNDFSKTLENDIAFFKDLQIQDFKLLIMYYELGKSHHPNISIEDANRMFSLGGTNLRPSKLSKDYSEIQKDDIRADASLFDFSLRQELTFLNENYGFEASFNDFKCFLIFVFDDIVFNNSRNRLLTCFKKENYYEDYFKSVQDKFEESILK